MIKYYKSGSYDPKIATNGAAGMDLYVNEVKTLSDHVEIKTGIHVEIPSGWVGLLMPRSSWGLAGWSLANTLGVIDSDYRGEIIIKAKHDNTRGFSTVKVGERVAQMVTVRCMPNTLTEVPRLEDLAPTTRGANGFGSTGGA